MSWKLCGRVQDLAIGLSQKVVLLHFANCADDDGNNAYPSLKRVAATWDISLSTVQRAIRQFKQDGVMVERENAGGGRGLTVNYRVDVGRAEEVYGVRRWDRENKVMVTTFPGGDKPGHGDTLSDEERVSHHDHLSGKSRSTTREKGVNESAKPGHDVTTEPLEPGDTLRAQQRAAARERWDRLVPELRERDGQAWSWLSACWPVKETVSEFVLGAPTQTIRDMVQADYALGLTRCLGLPLLVVCKGKGESGGSGPKYQGIDVLRAEAAKGPLDPGQPLGPMSETHEDAAE